MSTIVDFWISTALKIIGSSSSQPYVSMIKPSLLLHLNHKPIYGRLPPNLSILVLSHIDPRLRLICQTHELIFVYISYNISCIILKLMLETSAESCWAVPVLSHTGIDPL
jgi:hypothetical protein